MNPKTYSIIGLMSGTSGDGLDMAYCRFHLQEHWSFEILDAITIPFPDKLGRKLLNSHRLPALDLALLDVEFGQWMGEQVKNYCKEKEAKPMAVCSHGHTVFHQPKQGLSLQIGNGWALHQSSGQRVINDFRMLDVQLGGQGAPLVPIGDRLLFPQMEFCLNLGGIANISMEYQGKRIAFDTCPFNLLLNAQAKKLGAEYDANGNWAKEGTVNEALFRQLNSLKFYQSQSAKSLGREDLEEDFTPLIEQSKLSEKDVLSTLVEHFASQIADTVRYYRSSEKPAILITGGGAYNSYFIERLDAHLKGHWKLYQSSSKLVEFKEAMVFAFLGLLKLRGEINCLASVTGAINDSSGGVIYG